MGHLTRLFVAVLLAGAAFASSGTAVHAQDRGDRGDREEVQVIDQPTVVHGTPQRPAAFYVLQRSNRAADQPELRRSFVREVVRSTRALR